MQRGKEKKQKNANMLCILLTRPEEINQLEPSTIIYLGKVPRSQRKLKGNLSAIEITHSLTQEVS